MYFAAVQGFHSTLCTTSPLKSAESRDAVSDPTWQLHCNAYSFFKEESRPLAEVAR